MTAAEITGGWSLHRCVAERIREQAVDVTEARDLFEMLGLVEPGGRELLPDPRPVVGPADDDPARAPKAPLSIREPKPKSTAPPGLYAVPDPPPAAKKSTPKKTPAPRTARTAAAKPRRARKVAACGTPSGAMRHTKRSEPVCDPCREARNAAQRKYDAARRARLAAAAAELADGLTTQPAAERPASPQSVLVPVELDEWFAAAQRSPHRTVGRAAARAIGVLLQLRVAMDDLARAERAACSKEHT